MNTDPDVYHLKRKNNPLRSSAISFSYLGKVGATTHQQLQSCQQKLALLYRRSLQQHPISETPLVIGLAESGLLLSGLMHQILLEQKIEAHWICSTRRMTNGISFTESHSHGPNHVLPYPDCQPSELWFVEDEVTTGKTVFQLAVKLCKLFGVTNIRLFVLVDSRSQEEILQFQRALLQHEILCTIEAENKIDKKQRVDLFSPSKLPLEPTVQRTHHSIPSGWHFPSLRPALRSQVNSWAELAHPVKGSLKGSLLVVGEAIDVALKIVQHNPDLSFQHITLSPWEIDHVSIFSCLEIENQYYLYNYEKLSSPIYLLADPLDKEIEKSARRLLIKLGFEIAHVNCSTFFLNTDEIS